MQLTASTKRKITASAIAVLASALFGLVYPFFFVSQQPSGGPAWHAHVNGAAIGALIGLALSFGEMYLFKTRVRRLRFSFFILVQTLYYIIAINLVVIGVMISHNIIFHGHTFAEETQ